MIVVSSSPADTETGVYLNPDVTITFDSNVDIATVTDTNLYVKRLKTGVSYPLNASVAGGDPLTLDCYPSVMLAPSENYEIYVQPPLADTGAVEVTGVKILFTTGTTLKPAGGGGTPATIDDHVVTTIPADLAMVSTHPESYKFLEYIHIQYDADVDNITSIGVTMTSEHLFDDDLRHDLPSTGTITFAGDTVSIPINARTNDWYDNECLETDEDPTEGDATFFEGNLVTVSVVGVELTGSITPAAHTFQFITRPYPYWTTVVLTRNNSQWGHLVTTQADLDLLRKIAFLSYDLNEIAEELGIGLPACPTRLMKKVATLMVYQGLLNASLSIAVSAGDSIEKELGDFRIRVGSQSSLRMLEGYKTDLDKLLQFLMIELFQTPIAGIAFRGLYAAFGRRSLPLERYGTIDTSVSYEDVENKYDLYSTPPQPRNPHIVEDY